MFFKYNFPAVVKEDSLSFTDGGIVHAWEFVIFTHFLVTTHIFQPVFEMISDLKRVKLIRCKINQTVDSVSDCLIFQ